MRLNSHQLSRWMIVFLHLIVMVLGQDMDPQPTVSPKTEFVASPTNVTVLEGHPAVLRCKLKNTVHNCQWFYLEMGLDMFDKRSKPVLVKEFRPTKRSDCSIKFSKTRLYQSGQWICKGVQIQARKYVISDPAFLQVLKIDAGSTVHSTTNVPEENENEDDSTKEIIFKLSHEGHIVNTKLGDLAMIGCHASRKLETCSWIRPDGTTLRFIDGTNENYIQDGTYAEGNCSLKIQKVTERDEGNWRCIISVANSTGEKLGPLIHLHVLEYGTHGEGQGFTGERTNDPSLIIILVVTSVVLLIIIIVLVCYMYKHSWRRRNSPPHKYLESNTSGNEYSTYGSTWLPGNESKDQKLIEDSTELNESKESSGNEYTRYLDMRGKGKPEGYVSFPASGRSSVSSRTTASIGTVGKNYPAGTERSSGNSITDTVNASKFGSSIITQEMMQGRPLPERQDSTCSQGHLYEDIDEMKRMRLENPDQPTYGNIEEDQEGYMIPKQCNTGTLHTPETAIQTDTPQSSDSSEDKTEMLPKATPYSKIGENGLVPDSNSQNMTSNPTYSSGDETQPISEEMTTDSYDMPNEPPLPTRVESLDNPLAQYDVPKKSSQEDLPVFV